MGTPRATQLEDRRFRWRDEPYAFLVLFIAGALAGAGIMFVDQVWATWHGQAPELVERAQTRLWLAFLFAQTGIWLALQLPAWNVARSLPERGRIWSTVTGFAIVVGLTITAGVLFSPEIEFPLPGVAPKIWVITGLGLTAALPSVLAIWRVHRLAAQLRHDLHAGAGPDRIARDVLNDPSAHPIAAIGRLRELLDRALVQLGIMIGVAVAGIGAFRNAVNAWPAPPAEGATERYPFEWVLLWGAFYSLLLAAFYVPTYLRLQLLARDVIEELVPVDSSSGEWLDGFEKRQKVETVLRLDPSVTSSLTAGAAILAPLTVSLLGLLLSTD